MITLPATAGILVASTAVVLAALWASLLSTGAALRGPGWAHHHLSRARPAHWAAVAAGIAATALVQPFWVGLTWLYVASLVLWLTGRVRRALAQVETAGGFDPLPAARQAAIMRQTGRRLLLGAAVLALLTLADFVWRGWPAAFDVLLVGALAVPGALLTARAGAP